MNAPSENLHNIGRLLRDGNIEAARLAYEGVSESDRNSLYGQFLGGGIAYHCRQFSSAAQALTEVVDKQPTNREARLLLGMTYLALERYQEATGSFEQLLAVEPEHYQALYFFAHALTKSKRLPEAHAALERAIAVDPTAGKRISIWAIYIFTAAWNVRPSRRSRPRLEAPSARK